MIDGNIPSARPLSLEESMEFDEELERARINNSESGAESLSRPTRRELDLDQMRGIAVRVDEIVENADFADTALPAITFSLFNFLRLNPNASEEELKRELHKLQDMSNKESEYSNARNPLPTIGVEVEVPDWKLTQDKVAVLDILGIPNYAEVRDYLWEVNPNYSYSAEVQSRILQELVKLDAIPIDARTSKMRKDVLLSLHVNFGMPTGISTEELIKYRQQMTLLNDLVVYAFSSYQRILGRKFRTSYRFDHDAASSEKSQRRPSHPSRLSSRIVRLELRAGEFRDYPTFRMLSESQRLVAMFVAYVKTRESIATTFSEACLADLWVDFEKEGLAYLKEQDLVPNAIDNEITETHVVSSMIFTTLRADARSIITRYANKVSDIIK